MTTTTIQDRVQRGAALLDAKFPGWHNEVDIATLDLASGCSCILGQKFGDFMVGARQTGLSIETASTRTSMNTRLKLEEHGFLVNFADDEYILNVTFGRLPTDAGFIRTKKEYTDLTNEWAQIITNRRAAEQLSNVTESELVNA